MCDIDKQGVLSYGMKQLGIPSHSFCEEQGEGNEEQQVAIGSRHGVFPKEQQQDPAAYGSK